MNDFADLDALFRGASARAHQDRRAKDAAKLKEAPKEPAQTLYLNPDNWERTRGVALIHSETQTVLGNFSEYIHKTVPGCRKLVRESAPISISASEQVAGSWWLEDIKPEPRQVWHEQRPALIHLHLSKLSVHAPGVEVIAHLSYGSLARVELAAETQFAQEGSAPQLLTLPAGANVLEVMSGDCKTNLLQELGK